MIRTEGTTIHLTRGDATGTNYNRLAFNFPIYNLGTKQEENYLFQLDDKISFVVVNKKGYTKEELLRKEYTPRELGYTAPAETVDIPLTEEDTKNTEDSLTDIYVFGSVNLFTDSANETVYGNNIL